MLQLRQSIRRKDKEKNVETEADHARPTGPHDLLQLVFISAQRSARETITLR